MRVSPLFPAIDLMPSDTDEYHNTWAGIGGLRHKSRHKPANCPVPGVSNGSVTPVPAHVPKKVFKKIADSHSAVIVRRFVRCLSIGETDFSLPPSNNEAVMST